MAPASIPITVFTGFLGAGKTTIILSLLSKLPKDYKVVLLKNEFGDIEVDSKLARQSSLTAVSEILNGCMCCVLVGQMQSAIVEIRDTYHPDRIIIECSGSAFPATLAFQIRQLAKDTQDDFNLDGVITVVDAENFIGYEDISPTAKMQASYSDIILINKWEHVTERALDIVMDHLHTLNDTTPKVKCQGRNGVHPDLIFGVQSKLFLENKEIQFDHDDVETVTISKSFEGGIEKDTFLSAMELIEREVIWRVKGFVKLRNEEKWYSVNWAFGRNEIKEYDGKDVREDILITVMGVRDVVKDAVDKFMQSLVSNNM